MRKLVLLPTVALLTFLAGCAQDVGSSPNPAPEVPENLVVVPPPAATADSSQIIYRGVVIDPVADAGSVLFVPYYDTLNAQFRIQNDSLTVTIAAWAIGSFDLNTWDSTGHVVNLGSLVSMGGTAKKPEIVRWKGALPSITSNGLDLRITNPSTTTERYTIHLLAKPFAPILTPGTGHIASLDSVPHVDSYQTTSLYSSPSLSGWKLARGSVVALAPNGVSHLFSILDVRNMSAPVKSGSYSTSSNTGMLLNISPLLEKDTREIATDFVIKPKPRTCTTICYEIIAAAGSGDYLAKSVVYSKDSLIWLPYSHINNPERGLFLLPPDPTPTYFKAQITVDSTLLSSNVVRVDFDPVALVAKPTADSTKLSWTGSYADSIQIYSGADCQHLALRNTFHKLADNDYTGQATASFPQNTSTCYQTKVYASPGYVVQATSDQPGSLLVLTSRPVMVP